jgi:D-alanyl-D-alanine carboxypeptidase (penicillin-binding protein 5/6)
MPTRTAATLLALALSATGCSAPQPTSPSRPAARPVRTAAVPAGSWPHDGQASYALAGQVVDSPAQRPVPIASVAKLMTAYLTLRRLPAGARLEVGRADVTDTRRRAERGESVVPVAPGEVLDRHQALTALLLPSANNVAGMLAERIAGSQSAFVTVMNRTAAELGMVDTTYTDPSGFEATTVSTAHDQLLLLRALLRSPEPAGLMGQPSAVLPVAGRVHNTNSLLGHDGFTAGKTGSTSAAGGCLAFRVVRGQRVLDGVVLGQHGGPLIAAALRAAAALADEVLPP